METLKAKANEFLDFLDEQLSDNKYAQMAKEKTGVKASIIALASISMLTLIVLLVMGEEFFTNAAVFFPPAFMTMTSLSKGKIDAPFWMTYWLIFNFLYVLESATGLLQERIPLYYWVKFLGLIWCFHPSTTGASHIYDNIFAKLLGADVADSDTKETEDDNSEKNFSPAEDESAAPSGGQVEEEEQEAEPAVVEEDEEEETGEI